MAAHGQTEFISPSQKEGYHDRMKFFVILYKWAKKQLNSRFFGKAPHQHYSVHLHQNISTLFPKSVSNQVDLDDKVGTIDPVSRNFYGHFLFLSADQKRASGEGQNGFLVGTSIQQ